MNVPRLPKLSRFKLFSFRDLLITAAPPVLLIVLVIWAAYRYIDPMPPSHVVMATGPKNSGYEDFGKRYQAILKQHGVDLELRESLGSLDNLHQINDDNSDVQIGFVQSGTTDDAAADSDGLLSLGSLFSEPVWIFSHADHPLKTIAGMRGCSVNIGPLGSGLPQLMHKLLSVNQLDGSSVTLSMLDDDAAIEAFRARKIDVLTYSSAANSKTIDALLHDRSASLLNFRQAEAYTRHFPFLKRVVLPRGIVSFNGELPAHDIDLIAPTATLVATDGTHPAIIELLVQAASEVHSGPSWFATAGEYPNGNYSEIPIAKAADRYYKSGPPLLQRYLPFWFANLVERMWVVLVSLLALLLPLSRVLPPIYTWRVRSRVYRWYGQLREVEHAVDESLASHIGSGVLQDRDLLGRQLERLKDLDARVNRLSVPLSYADELYALRQHIELVREKIRIRGGVTSEGLRHA